MLSHVCHAGAAYREVMQQIMAAIQSASQLEVAELIQSRAADGSLPPSGATNDTPKQPKATSAAADATADATNDIPTQPKTTSGDATAAAAAAVFPISSKRKAMDTEQAGVAKPEGSQMRNAKRARVEEGSGEPAQEAREGQAGSSGTSMQDQYARGQVPAMVIMPDDEAMQSAQPSSSTQTRPGPSSQTQPEPHTQAQPELSTRTQPGPHTQAQPELSTQTQPGPNPDSQSQPGPSLGMPDQDMQEEADPRVKEKRELARSRTRAWRKVLLDGLDLQSELTAAAAQQPHFDSALAEAEVKVRPSCWYHLIIQIHASLCYAMLCYAMLCYAMLSHAIPCCALLCYAIVCCAMLRCAVLCLLCCAKS